MENRKKNFFFYIKKIFKPFDTVRKIIINIVFWSLVILLLIGLFAGSGINLTGKSNALVLNIQGNVVEELSGSTLSRTIGSINGYDMSETLLWDILEAVNRAESDSGINAILLDLRHMQNAGLGALTEIHQSLMAFRESGKSIIAYSDYYSQGQYFLASAADEIYADPMGDFFISGFSVYNRYYGEGLQRLGVDVNYFHAGKFKSFGEVYTRSSMSDEAKEANRTWSGDLWEHYVETVSGSRSISAVKFNKFIDDYIRILNEAGGNSVEAAFQSTLLDGLMDRDQLRSHMTAISGYSMEYESFNQIFMDEYLALRREIMKPAGDKIALINASGTIYNGYEEPGNIGGDSLVELIERVQFDNSYKALVLRVDSGGGSSFASEIIRRKLEKLRQSGVPVVISMGSVAASGGYWIATSSDEVWAQPTTITGSIGVFSLITTFEDPLSEYLGITVDGVGTTWLAGTMRSDRDLDPEVGQIFQSSVDFVYDEFLNLVSTARAMDVEDVHKIAQGRVWSGSQARELGLVDNLGGMEDAIGSAAMMAGLEEGEYSSEFIRQQIPLSDQMINTLLENARVSRFFKDFSLFYRLAENSVLKPIHDLRDLNDPSGVFALTTLIFE